MGRIIVVGMQPIARNTIIRHRERNRCSGRMCTNNTLMRGPKKKKATIIPILLEGTAAKSFPPILSDKVFSDFRKPEAYFGTALDLLLSLYEISPQHLVSIELRELLAGRKEF